MKGATMLVTLQKLGIAASFRRPGVSDDNAQAEAFFRTLKYRSGHDTLGRVFGLIAPEEFEPAFRRWVAMVLPSLAEDTVVAIDGKSSRRTASKGNTSAPPLHMVRNLSEQLQIFIKSNILVW